jgi:hypothetical protein
MLAEIIDPNAVMASIAALSEHLHANSVSDAILHLQAVSLVVTAAYLGFDRVHIERDQLHEILNLKSAMVNDLVNKLDITRGDGLSLKHAFQTFDVYVLCHVARIRIRLGFFKRPAHVLHRQYYVPLLEYYRRKDSSMGRRLYVYQHYDSVPHDGLQSHHVRTAQR